MNKTVKSEAEKNLEDIIGYFLRTGVLLAGGLLLVGWVGILRTQGSQLHLLTHYESEDLASLIEWAMLTDNKGMTLSFLGLFVLISLPVLRVGLTGILFLKQKDYRMAFIAFFVFMALFLSFSLGLES